MVRLHKTNQKTGFLLKVIAVLNFLYCCISLALVLYHYHTLTKLGWIYILIEIIIVLLLAIIEFIIGRKLIKVNIKRHA